MNDSATPLLNEMTSIQAYITAARDFIKDGLMPDMSVIEKRISDLCIGIQNAEAGEQGSCLPGLASLLKNLDECERDIRAWKAQQTAKVKL